MSEDFPKGNSILDFFNDTALKLEFDEPSNETISTPSEVQTTTTKTPLETADFIREKIDSCYKNLPEDVRKIIYVAYYVVDVANISGYQLLSNDRLIIFLLLDGKNWRSHSYKPFHYIDGCWEEKEKLTLPSLDLLTAVEGLFIKLSEEKSNLTWVWYEVQRLIGEIIDSVDDANMIVKELCIIAKVSGDYVRQLTKNRVYTAPWMARIVDMICQVKKSFDYNSTIDEITKTFHTFC